VALVIIMQKSTINTPMFFTIRKGIDPKQASFALFNYPSKFLKQSQTHYVQAVTYTINNLI
jgi:hypothetical protein